MKNILKIGTLAFLASAILVPAAANAQDWRREETANEWKNIATVSGALSVLGLLNHDDTLTFAGAAGALYSTYRFEEDRKSLDRHARLRASYFDRDYFYRDGCRYERRVVNQGGKRYYQFVNVNFNSRNQGSDWYRTNERHDDAWRRAEDRRIAEQRRIDEQRRRDEDRRRDEERRREEQRRKDDARRRDEERRREEARRRDQDNRDRDHRNDRDHDRDRDRNRGGRDH